MRQTIVKMKRLHDFCTSFYNYNGSTFFVSRISCSIRCQPHHAIILLKHFILIIRLSHHIFCHQFHFHARNRTQLYSVTETVWHGTQTVQHDWPESCFAARNCDELVSNFSCKFLVQVPGPSYFSMCRQQKIHRRFCGVF